MRKAAVILLGLLALVLWLAPTRAQNWCSNCPVTETTTVLAQAQQILSVVSVNRENGPGCDHYLITVDYGGTPRTIKTTKEEMAQFFAPGNRGDTARELVLRVVAYRRFEGLPIAGDIR